MPYSIAYLKAFIDANSKIETKCLDLNAKFHKIKFGDIDRIVQQSNAYHDDKMDYWSHVEEISAYAAEAAIQLRQFYEPEFIVRQARNRPSELTGKSTAFDTYYQLLRNGRKNLYDKFIDELIREF